VVGDLERGGLQRQVLVGVGEGDEVERALPGVEAEADGGGQRSRAGPAVDQRVAAAGRADDDGVALADVEKGDVQLAVGQAGHGADPDGEGDRPQPGEQRGCRQQVQDARPALLVAEPQPGGDQGVEGAREHAAGQWLTWRLAGDPVLHPKSPALVLPAEAMSMPSGTRAGPLLTMG
jgi:hypothetical protein